MAEGSRSNIIFSTTVVVVLSILAARPIFSFEHELSLPELATYTEEAKNLALTELGISPLGFNASVQLFTHHQVQDLYLFITFCVLIPPPDEGYVENKKIMLHLLRRLIPQNRYAVMNISTTRDSTKAIGGGYCNGTVWEHDAYREKCTYCTDFLTTDAFADCHYSAAVGVGFDIAQENLVNCLAVFTTPT